MAYKTIEELINDSIRVIPGMIAVYPQYSQEEVINVSEIVPKFPGRYATNNSTVAFVHNGNFFVTPYTRSAMNLLAANGFKEAYFYVPFSNWDYPKAEKYRWEQLRAKAHKSYEEDFVADCNRYCDEHGFGEISEETLQRCFKMPSTGVHVKHLYFEDFYYPIINTLCLDCIGVERIGHYCSNNGRVVFVYRDGGTYVAKGDKILEELRSAGYKEMGLFVPFSNGEQIQDRVLRAKWDALSK